MSEIDECLFELDTCPICLDDIEFCSNNYIKTSCKHNFHASCFLTHTNRNGYSCPCCRTELVESNSDSDSDSDSYSEQYSISPLNNYAQDLSLLAFRYLMRRVENDEDDDISDNDSIGYSDHEDMYYQRGHAYNSLNISISDIACKLNEAGMTYEDLVALYVLPHKDNLRDKQHYDAEWIRRTENLIESIIVPPESRHSYLESLI